MSRLRPIAWLVLAVVIASLGYSLWRRPLLTSVLVTVVVAATVIQWLFARRHLLRLAASRTGEADLGAFARQFDLARVDAKVIRAVFEALQDHLSSEVEAFPLRPSDSLTADLKIDEGDLEDLIASRVAERSGRSLEAAESNPLHGTIRTVGDLVLFFNAQPRVTHADEPPPN